MKNLLLILFVLLLGTVVLTQENPSLVNIPHEVFVNGGRNDFEKIIWEDESIKEKVKTLHAYDELTHEFTISTNSFEEYWLNYEKQWHYIKFRPNSSPVLIFFGYKNFNDELEYVEIYDPAQKRNERLVFSEVGQLLAYKINERNQELILYTHRYPCCQSASHNIFKIRQLNGQIKVSDRFFVGRDSGDMVGPFFATSVKHQEKYYRLKEKTALRWSPAIVEKDAFEGWSHNNLIIHYEKGAIYKVLATENDWQFVIFFSGISEEQSRMLNYTNFIHKAVYGWIKK